MSCEKYTLLNLVLSVLTGNLFEMEECCHLLELPHEYVSLHYIVLK